MGYTVVVPTLNPAPEFPDIIAGMTSQLIDHIVIVNDGSDASYDEIFNRAEEQAHVIVLRHEENRGKGRAMKTAFAYIRDHLETEGVITVDSDGQHLIRDVERCLLELKVNPDALVLGVRDFHGDNVPARSRFGNRMTSLTFLIGCGIRVSDTQTGLRAFSSKYLDLLIQVRGERYEYETEMLLILSREKVPFREVTIETVYLNENEASHFHPIRDSFRIYVVIFKYIASSLTSWAIDTSVFTLLNFLLVGILPTGHRAVAQIVARLVSSVVNYILNRRFVFESKNHIGRELFRYYLLCVLNLTASVLLVHLFTYLFRTSGIWDTVVMIAVNCFLFIVVYIVKQRIVFAKNRRG